MHYKKTMSNKKKIDVCLIGPGRIGMTLELDKLRKKPATHFGMWLKNKNANSSVSLTRFYHPHPEKIQIIKKKFVKSYLNKESMRPRQYLPEVYCLNGLFYIAKSEQLVKKKSFFSNKTSPFIVKYDQSLNLDLPDDLLILKDKIKKKIINQNFLK